MKKQYPPEFTPNEEETLMYGAPVQCGDCYNYYDATKHHWCPVCGSKEIVGDR